MLDIIETTPQCITRKQGGALWLISMNGGLMHLYTKFADGYLPVTVFIHAPDSLRARVLWAHPNATVGVSEF